MVVLPYIDLTLMGCNASFGIILCIILSTAFLGEKFFWKYDFTAFVFISAGCTTVVLNAHTEEVSFTAEEAKDLMLSARALSFFGAVIFFCVVISLTMRFFLIRLRRFEVDVDYFDEQSLQTNPNHVSILPARTEVAPNATSI